jgi:hypothetical protein
MSEVPSRDALDGTSFGVKQGGAEGSGRIDGWRRTRRCDSALYHLDLAHS